MGGDPLFGYSNLGRLQKPDFSKKRRGGVFTTKETLDFLLVYSVIHWLSLWLVSYDSSPQESLLQQRAKAYKAYTNTGMEPPSQKLTWPLPPQPFNIRIWKFANVGVGGSPSLFQLFPIDSFFILSQASGTDGVNLTRINESNWTKNLSTWHLWSCQMDVCSSVCCSGGWTLSLLVILCHQQVLHWLFGLPLIGDVWASWAPGPPFAFRTHGPPQY